MPDIYNIGDQHDPVQRTEISVEGHRNQYNEVQRTKICVVVKSRRNQYNQVQRTEISMEQT